jgi:hypothetical protein
MNRQMRSPLLMVVAFLLIGSATWIIARGSQTEDSGQEEVQRLYVFAFDPQEVLWLEIRDPEADLWCTVEKDEDQWWAQSTSRLRASDAEVMGLLGQISMLKSSRVIAEEDVDLNGFGLADPSYEFRLGLRTGEETGLLIGGVSPNGLFYYAVRSRESEGYTLPVRTIDRLTSLSRELCAEFAKLNTRAQGQGSFTRTTVGPTQATLCSKRLVAAGAPTSPHLAPSETPPAPCSTAAPSFSSGRASRPRVPPWALLQRPGESQRPGQADRPGRFPGRLTVRIDV